MIFQLEMFPKKHYNTFGTMLSDKKHGYEAFYFQAGAKAYQT